jgi:hypothetical protein
LANGGASAESMANNKRATMASLVECVEKQGARHKHYEAGMRKETFDATVG